MTKIKVVKKQTEQRHNKNPVCLEKIKVRYNKNQSQQEKLNKKTTKSKVF